MSFIYNLKKRQSSQQFNDEYFFNFVFVWSVSYLEECTFYYDLYPPIVMVDVGQWKQEKTTGLNIKSYIHMQFIHWK